ncbi:unnamed protein product [Calicophoron daubneyi]|uniref:EGF-like domain-containing protein n=1 Tax=Calicophoron daubneyi TaxID=300641 RepID=A0AAV2U280_CALDB
MSRFLSLNVGFIGILIYFVSFNQTTASFLTNKRVEEIRFFFNHFTPFEDMVHVPSRAQRMGIQFETPFKNVDRLLFYKDCEANVTKILEIYLNTAAQVLGLSSTVENVTTLRELLNTSVNCKKINPDLFLYHLLKKEAEFEDGEYKKFYEDFADSQIMEGDAKDKGYSLLMLLMRAWTPIFLLEVSSSHDWFKSGKKTETTYSGTLSKIHDQWSLMFIDQLCTMIYNLRDANLPIPLGFCPNPCLTLPCVTAPHTSSTKCVPIGPYWNSYRCTCQTKFTWIQLPTAEGHCQVDDKCANYCNEEGTRRCDVIDQKVFCVCRPTHMGRTCSDLRDPCVELSSPSEMPGNMSCNTGQGGKCIGVPGTNTYSCVCPLSFTSDPSYPFPNCLAFKDRCATTMCVQGDCVSSRDGQEVYCICPDEAYGEFCEHVRGKWAQWSPWSECTPNCGISEFQRRVRTRGCLGEACRGGEGHLQMEMCPTLPCPDETLALSRQGRKEEIGELKIQMLQAQSARYVKLVGAVAKALVVLSCVFAAVTATAMAASVYLM